MAIGAQMIVSQAPDAEHGASRFSIYLPELGLPSTQSSLAVPHSSLLEWGCLLCTIVHWKYVTCFLKL